MKGNEYNELLVLIDHMDKESRSRIPQKFVEYLKERMIPGGETDIDPLHPFNADNASRKAVTLLAMITMLYLTENDKDRWEIADTFHHNQLEYEGKEIVPMTEEEYQDFLKEYDEWNESFGPIPFWSVSRRWQPRYCYELVKPGAEANLQIGKIGLKEIYVPEEERQRIITEAKQWYTVEDVHDLYKKDSSTDEKKMGLTVPNDTFYKNSVILLDGKFAGTVVNITDPAYFDTVPVNGEHCGILLINGKTAGEVQSTSYTDFPSGGYIHRQISCSLHKKNPGL